MARAEDSDRSSTVENSHWAAHNENRFPVGQPPDVEDWRTAKPTQLARRDTP